MGGGAGGEGGHEATWELWKRHSIEVIKTPFLPLLAEESLVQLHPLNDIIVFNESQLENFQRAPHEASAAGKDRGLTSSLGIGCLEF